MRRFIVVSMLAVAITATAQLPASAATGAPRVFIVEGHGWGHGRGMGQYGARALAAAGTPWFRILTKYYTGIQFAKMAKGQRIRVLLSHDQNVVVEGDSRITMVTGGKVVVRTKRGGIFFSIARARSSTAITAVSSRSQPWRMTKTVAPRTIRLYGALKVGIVRGRTVRWYQGSIDLVPSSDGFDVINIVGMERYVAEVVPREMPASWPLAALESQAVAARTYALRVLTVARANHRGYDICAKTACQVFGGYAWTRDGLYQVLESKSSNAAAAATAGYVMTWRGKAVLAEYSSSTGGYTASGGVPYLSPRPDPWDAGAPLHSWTETVSAADIQSVWPDVGAVRDVRVISRDGFGDFGGRALRLVIVGSRRALQLSGAEFEAAFGLPSDWFRLRLLAPPRAPYHFMFDMGEGTHNVAVQYLQQRLRAAGFFPSNVKFSTYFGPITRSALRAYQKANHIPATGFLGPKTRARLNAAK